MLVTIKSFSYRKGYPIDHSGHGGGFVFDCRMILNPGKIEKFTTLSGLDQETADWFETNSASIYQSYLSQVITITQAHINAFLERGFTSVAINFGCTGGQHRSVFMTEKFKDHLNHIYNNKHSINKIEFKIEHTEQENWPQAASRNRQW